MDPLSITAGVFSLLAACIKTATILKDFYDCAAIADTKVKGLLTEVQNFTQVLRLMKDTLEEENIQASFQTTGHIGDHLSNLATSILDSQRTLSQLQETIEKVNKSVTVFDGARKHLRLRSAADEISVYQQQIRSYKDTLQLTLQTVILWNQVSFRESADKILPNLDDIQQAIRRNAIDLNGQISGLQSGVESKPSDHQLHNLQNLRNCLKTAASIVSSASTTLSVDRPNRRSIAYESDFGDCFPSEPGETMLRWMSSNTVYEFEEERGTTSSLSGLEAASKKPLELIQEGRESDQSDSDGELEAEIVRSLLRRGKDKLASQEFEAAERHFRNCLTRVSSNGSSLSSHRPVGSKSEIMTLLLITYRHQEKWDEAHSLLMEKIAFESRGSPKANQGVLADTLFLVEVLLKKCAYAEALLYGRRALKGYRKLGLEGALGVQNSLRLLCQVCKAVGNHDEEDAYAAILSDTFQHPQSSITPTSPTISEDHDDDSVLSKIFAIDKARLQEIPSVHNADDPDSLRSNSSWVSSSQSTSTSMSPKSHRRWSSISSFGSSGATSPHTAYGFSSIKSQPGSPEVKNQSLSPRDTFTSQSPSLNQLDYNHTSKQMKDKALSRPLIPAVDTSAAQRKKKDDHEVISIAEPRQNAPLISVSDPVADIQQSRDNIAAASMDDREPFSPISQNLNLESLKRDSGPSKEQTVSLTLQKEESAVPLILQPPGQTKRLYRLRRPIALELAELNQAVSSLEGDAIEYFRAKKGDQHRTIPPEPRIPVSVSDYELLQWIGTHPDFPFTKKMNMTEESLSSLNVPQKTLLKSKSATDLFNLGIAELPAEPLQRSKSSVALQSLTSTEFKKSELVETTSNVSDEADDQLLQKLTEMGYPRIVALAALEKYDYDLEKAANYLASGMVEELDLPRSQTSIRSKRMGVLDPFHFHVSSAPEIGTTMSHGLPTFEALPRPVSFQSLVKLQSTKTSANSDRLGPPTLTSHRSESNLTTPAKSHKKSRSFESLSPNNRGAKPTMKEIHPAITDSRQDELLDVINGLKIDRPRNPMAARLSADSSGQSHQISVNGSSKRSAFRPRAPLRRDAVCLD